MNKLTSEEKSLIESMRAELIRSANSQEPGFQYKLRSVEERIIETAAGAAPVIVYTPIGEPDEKWPVLVSMHGGGFVLGRAYMDGPYCRRIASCAGCIVVNVDYLLAPEHPFPAALEQCYGVIRWLWEHADELHADKNRIAVGGYSAGGNLSAAVCLMAKEYREFSILCQVLCYPPLDIAKEPGDKNSAAGNEGIPVEIARLFNKSYSPEPDKRKNPLISPVYAADLSGLPPALIITAEQDNLAHEAINYANLLRDAEISVMSKHFKGVGHAFTHEPTEAANEAWELICSYLSEKFNYR